MMSWMFGEMTDGIRRNGALKRPEVGYEEED